ncbi:hypothetical protein LU290_08195 [Moraxella nasibovis]|uniref:hypothetical protein n=1 Tax=Moraxella nasibovis TaxID=2904120 RepID=UPI0024104549|nr:hypothetical protein [Moraxella nasibovis]WFF38229.1 hypothetical protein LU290_08195 [Moraxella nasibovis]
MTIWWIVNLEIKGKAMETFLIAFLFSGFYIFIIISFGFLFAYLIYLMIQKFKNHQENNDIKIIKTPKPEKYILTKQEIQELLLSENFDKYNCKNCAMKEKDLYEVFKNILKEYKIYPTKMDLDEKEIENRESTIELLSDGSYQKEYTAEPHMLYHCRYTIHYPSYDELYQSWFGRMDYYHHIEIIRELNFDIFSAH